MKRNNLFLLLFLFVMSLVLLGCTSITIEESTLEMKKGTTAEISAIVKGKGDVVWTSSNELVCTVENGKVTAVGIGEATVKATIKDKEDVYFTYIFHTKEKVNYILNVLKKI